MSAPLYEHPTEIRFQDVDAAGILFFARVFDLFHDAFFAGLAARGIRFAEVLAAKRWASPLVHAEADYRRPMRFGDRVVVELVRVELGNTSMTTRYRIRGADDPNQVHASGHLVHAFVLLEPFRSCPVPDEVRDALGGEP
jgi:YbgC/YbaW family acyl-CoA thioester hydrolase